MSSVTSNCIERDVDKSLPFCTDLLQFIGDGYFRQLPLLPLFPYPLKKPCHSHTVFYHYLSWVGNLHFVFYSFHQCRRIDVFYYFSRYWNRIVHRETGSFGV